MVHRATQGDGGEPRCFPLVEKVRIRSVRNATGAAGGGTSVSRQNQGFYDKLQAGLPKGETTMKCTVRLIFGCHDNQLSLDGTFNGLFTGAAFHNANAKRMPPTQTPKHFVVGQANASFRPARPAHHLGPLPQRCELESA